MQPTISAKARDLVSRRKELLGAGIAVVVAVGIISREQWIGGFGFSIPNSFLVIANVLVGATLLAAALLARGFAGVGRALDGLAGLLAFLAGAILALDMGFQNWPGVAMAGDLAASGLALAASGMFGLTLRHFWQDLRTHRRVVGLFLVLWLALLGVAMAEWFVDAGRNLLVWTLSITFLLLLPIPASFQVGWWRNLPTVRPDEHRIADSFLGGGLVGLLVMLLNTLFAVTLTIIGVSAFGELYGRVAFVTVYVFAAVGLVLGAVVGLIGGGLAAIWRHWQSRGRSAVHAGTL
jgi:hypothetical protein